MTRSGSDGVPRGGDSFADGESRYRALVEHMHTGLALHEIICDGNGIPTDYRFLEVNPAFERLTGLRKHDIIGKTALEVLPGLERSWIERYGQVALTGTPQRFEEFSAGLGRYFEVTAFRPAPGRFAALFSDITARKALEQALRESEGRLRRFVEASPTVTFALELHGDDIRPIWISGNVSRILGFEAHDALTPGWWERQIHPDDRKNVLASLGGLIKAGRRHEVDYRLERKDGTYVWIRERARVVEDDSQREIVGSWSDVTDYLEAQARERLAARLSQVLLDSFPCVALLLRPGTREIVFSNAAARAVGAVPGETCFGTWGGQEEACPWCLAPELWGDGKAKDLVVEAGGVIWDAHWIPVDENLYMHYAFDITESRRMGEALREAEEKLRQGQRMEAVGRLAGGVAHDFNNLLTAIIGHVDLLQADLEPSTSRGDNLDEIRKAAERAAVLTRQLLAFSRRQALVPHVFDLNEVTGSLAGLLDRLIGDDVDLVFRQDPALWPVEADPGQIEQVLMNLTINARDAMPKGGKLTIETANVELDEGYVSSHLSAHPGPHVMLAVSDTGTGIDPDILPHVFEPFFTTKEEGKGTGLGLSTVYGIVKQSEGNIWVYSEPGCGTTFKIYLPRTDKPVDWSPLHRGDRATAPRGGQECILVVEDEPAVRSLAARILAQYGYRVLEAGSFDEALAAVGGHAGTVELLLTDVMLPGMTGQQLAEELTRRSRVPPRVLYMSGYTKNAIVHDGRLDEGIDFLDKPFTPETLLRKVREVLDRP